jgi:hypothetical protein
MLPQRSTESSNTRAVGHYHGSLCGISTFAVFSCIITVVLNIAMFVHKLHTISTYLQAGYTGGDISSGV